MYVLSRLLQGLVSLWGVVTVVFLMLHLSGNPAAIMAGPNSTPQQIHQISVQLGLNLPLYEQYLRYMGHVIHGNFGYSYVDYEPAMAVVLPRLRYTLELAVAGYGLALVLGAAAGLLSARYVGSLFDRALMTVVSLLQSVPSFWLGLLLILVFGVTLHLLPSSGAGSFASLVLPALTLTAWAIPPLARIGRAALLEESGRDYARTALAKGVAPWRVWTRHLARNAAVPFINIAAVNFATVLGGAVFVEVVFAWPGVGELTVQSAQSLDLPVVEAVTVIGALAFIVANLVADLLSMLVDPRIERGSSL